MPSVGTVEGHGDARSDAIDPGEKSMSRFHVVIYSVTALMFGGHLISQETEPATGVLPAEPAVAELLPVEIDVSGVNSRQASYWKHMEKIH